MGFIRGEIGDDYVWALCFAPEACDWGEKGLKASGQVIYPHSWRNRSNWEQELRFVAQWNEKKIPRS